jgi:hypothetical protein
VCTLCTRRAALLLCAAIGAAAACTGTTPLNVQTSTIVVHAVLNAAQDDQIVVVQRTSNGVPDAVPVDSAAVAIIGPDGVVMIGVEKTDSSMTRDYHITLSGYHEHLAPGATYQLRVKLKTGEEISGTTTIPSAQPVAPPAGTTPFNAATDTMRLAWSPVPGASSYEVRVQSTAGAYVLYNGDTSAVLPGTLRALEGKVVFADGLDHQVIVSAVDDAYYQYYRRNSDEYSGAAVQGNLTGAEGVFGSIVIVAQKSIHVSAAAP